MWRRKLRIWSSGAAQKEPLPPTPILSHYNIADPIHSQRLHPFVCVETIGLISITVCFIIAFTPLRLWGHFYFEVSPTGGFSELQEFWVASRQDWAGGGKKCGTFPSHRRGWGSPWRQAGKNLSSAAGVMMERSFWGRWPELFYFHSKKPCDFYIV